MSEAPKDAKGLHELLLLSCKIYTTFDTNRSKPPAEDLFAMDHTAILTF